MLPVCVNCGGSMSEAWSRCPGRPGFGCETAEERRGRLERAAEDRFRAMERVQREMQARHHYIDPMARALLIGEYIRNGNLQAAERMVRETAGHAHENARGGWGPLGQ